MKMTKILVGALAAVALVAGLTGCQKEIGDIDWKGTFSSGDGTKDLTVKQSNESDSIIRGMKMLTLKHTGANIVVRIYNQDEKSKDGMAGYAWNITSTKNDEGVALYNFFVLGVRSAEGRREYYLSYFANIAESELSADNFGATEIKTAYDKNATTPYEIVLKKMPTTFAQSLDGEGTLTVVISVVSDSDNKKQTVKLMKLYSEDAEQTGSATLDLTKCSELATVAEINVTSYGLETTDQKMGAYANIYAGKTLEAKWSYYDVTGNPIPVAGDISASPVVAGDIEWN